ncbi:hypothetical protein KPL37_09960 [Clostridium frigoris]|uniref:Uncharacterized protein n=1 Tax=Clostridium frigoris TaxID=205327 RepID=A0ABS6BW51_9CLOT|nr:hypothetical protein [Clostridium frigoris]MBU3160077.1 hypothetical protein [Clostridium frigoris]
MITLFIYSFTIIVTLIGLMVTVLGKIDKKKIIKQTKLIHEQVHLKDLKYKEISDNMNCKI